MSRSVVCAVIALALIFSAPAYRTTPAWGIGTQGICGEVADE